MPKLIITADIHGFLGSWLTIRNLLKKKDSLAVAGDLFDTKYGSWSNSDFAPDQIKKEIDKLENRFFYVYGNCDTASYSPGYDKQLIFTYHGKRILLHHGHRPIRKNDTGKIDIIIQGHTHLCSLEKRGGMVYLNPGSLSLPRNGMHTYAVLENNILRLVELKSGKDLIWLDL